MLLIIYFSIDKSIKYIRYFNMGTNRIVSVNRSTVMMRTGTIFSLTKTWPKIVMRTNYRDNLWHKGQKGGRFNQRRQDWLTGGKMRRINQRQDESSPVNLKEGMINSPLKTFLIIPWIIWNRMSYLNITCRKCETKFIERCNIQRTHCQFGHWARCRCHMFLPFSWMKVM